MKMQTLPTSQYLNISFHFELCVEMLISPKHINRDIKRTAESRDWRNSVNHSTVKPKLHVLAIIQKFVHSDRLQILYKIGL